MQTLKSEARTTSAGAYWGYFFDGVEQVSVGRGVGFESALVARRIERGQSENDGAVERRGERLVESASRP